MSVRFAEPTIIRRYTSLLKLYATNAPVLNDALFTVLHHVVGDAHRIELLFQPAVLKTFSEILGSELPLLQVGGRGAAGRRVGVAGG